MNWPLRAETLLLTLQPKLVGQLGRKVSGKEHVTAALTSPSGMSSSLPVSLLAGCEGYRVETSWREAGEHSLAVFMDGSHVEGSPLAVTVAPGALAAHASTVTNYRNAAGVCMCVCLC